ncbi:hypothetical protein RB195_001476 [Necator americanus]|uniref:G-protein coupled receptors family 1 profile domain-containing protein n=1 Tax=Necator americanus TaxID=51031 RepID=A0ABR1DG15_NECAM
MLRRTTTKGIVKEKSAFVELMGYHGINVKLGALCALLCIILLYCLLTNRIFRRKRKLIITLAAADLFNSLGILLMGVDRCLSRQSIAHVRLSLNLGMLKRSFN